MKSRSIQATSSRRRLALQAKNQAIVVRRLWFERIESRCLLHGVSLFESDPIFETDPIEPADEQSVSAEITLEDKTDAIDSDLIDSDAIDVQSPDDSEVKDGQADDATLNCDHLLTLYEGFDSQATSDDTTACDVLVDRSGALHDVILEEGVEFYNRLNNSADTAPLAGDGSDFQLTVDYTYGTNEDFFPGLAGLNQEFLEHLTNSPLESLESNSIHQANANTGSSPTVDSNSTSNTPTSNNSPQSSSSSSGLIPIGATSTNPASPLPMGLLNRTRTANAPVESTRSATTDYFSSSRINRPLNWSLRTEATVTAGRHLTMAVAPDVNDLQARHDSRASLDVEPSINLRRVVSRDVNTNKMNSGSQRLSRPLRSKAKPNANDATEVSRATPGRGSIAAAIPVRHIAGTLPHASNDDPRQTSNSNEDLQVSVVRPSVSGIDHDLLDRAVEANVAGGRSRISVAFFSTLAVFQLLWERRRRSSDDQSVGPQA